MLWLSFPHFLLGKFQKLDFCLLRDFNFDLSSSVNCNKVFFFLSASKNNFWQAFNVINLVNKCDTFYVFHIQSNIFVWSSCFLINVEPIFQSTKYILWSAILSNKFIYKWPINLLLSYIAWSIVLWTALLLSNSSVTVLLYHAQGVLFRPYMYCLGLSKGVVSPVCYIFPILFYFR